ncbi:MAG: hypothetical protein D6706_04285 [Chloroflexi bacterium]|nr:MAG: hypothetical protein D6706_04285 [Chloroflexota bacterium]
MNSTAYWDQFLAADYAKKLQLFEQYLNQTNDKALLAVQMLDVLYRETAVRHQRDRFQVLASLLHDKHPTLWQSESLIIHYRLLANALVEKRVTDIPDLLPPIAAQATKQITLFQHILDMLAYHGQETAVAQLIITAWPQIRQSTHLRPSAQQRFATQATDYLIYAHLKTAESDITTLHTQLAEFFPINPDGLKAHLAVLSGRRQFQWQLEDLVPAAETRPSIQQAQQNLATLMLEFMGWLSQKQPNSWGQADLFRSQFPDYLAARRTGQLTERDPIGDMMRRKRPNFQLPPEPVHPLCPDAATLTRYLEHLLHATRPQPYRAAVLFTLLPAWTRFLRSRQLLAPATETAVWQNLDQLPQKVANFWQNWPDDPLPGEHIKHIRHQF